MIPAHLRRSYLARQVGSLHLAQLADATGVAPLRSISWHNAALRLGVALPLFVVHDLGLLFAAPRGAGGWFDQGASGTASGEARRASPSARPRNVPPDALGPLTSWRELLLALADADVVQRAPRLRLPDDAIGLVVCRVLADAWQSWGYRSKATGAEELPLDPSVLGPADVAAAYADFDPAPWWAFLGHLAARRWHVLAAIEQVELETLKLAGLLGEEGVGVRGDPLDLFAALGSHEANEIARFSLELLPSVLETRRAAGVQAFAQDGYTSLERRGALDSLVPSELAHDDEVLALKMLEGDLLYYGRERRSEDDRRLAYLLVDASASMRGTRQVFARGLALALAKRLTLAGDEVWLRFFDAKLHELHRARGGTLDVPAILTFRGERGRNYGRVFRQLTAELERARKETAAQVTVFVITHGQCHAPVEEVQRVQKLARLHAVIVQPSSSVALDWLAYTDGHQVVGPEAFTSSPARRAKGLAVALGAGSR